MFFFLRLTYNPFLSLDYLVVFVSYSNSLLGRGDGELLRNLSSSHVREMWDCPCLNKVVVGLTLRARLLAYKREVKIKVIL